MVNKVWDVGSSLRHEFYLPSSLTFRNVRQFASLSLTFVPVSLSPKVCYNHPLLHDPSFQETGSWDHSFCLCSVHEESDTNEGQERSNEEESENEGEREAVEEEWVIQKREGSIRTSVTSLPVQKQVDSQETWRSQTSLQERRKKKACERRRNRKKMKRGTMVFSALKSENREGFQFKLRFLVWMIRSGKSGPIVKYSIRPETQFFFSIPVLLFKE